MELKGGWGGELETEKNGSKKKAVFIRINSIRIGWVGCSHDCLGFVI